VCWSIRCSFCLFARCRIMATSLVSSLVPCFWRTCRGCWHLHISWHLAAARSGWEQVFCYCLVVPPFYGNVTPSLHLCANIGVCSCLPKVSLRWHLGSSS